MSKKHLIAVAFAVRLISGQEPTDAAFDEAAFRKAVNDGLPTDHGERTVRYILSHEDIAIPILVEAIKAKLNDKQSEQFVERAIDWGTYSASERAADAVADLCATDDKRCPSFVKTLLNQAAARYRRYEISYYTVERYPNLLDVVAPLTVDSMKWSTSARDFARELVKREKAGHPLRDDDPLLSRLPAEARERVNRAIATARDEERQRPNR